MLNDEQDPFGGIEGHDHFLEHRGRLVGIYRAYGHTLLILRVMRARDGRRWPWLTLGVASLLADAALAVRARRPERSRMFERSVTEALEAAVWTRATSPAPLSSRPTALLGNPTAAEAGYLLGRAARPLTPRRLFCAAAPIASVTLAHGLSRSARGWSAGWGLVGWEVIAVGLGVGLGRNRTALRRRFRETWRDYAGPRVEAAWWYGQHDVTMDGADPRSPHNLKKDLLELEIAGSSRARAARFWFASRQSEVNAESSRFGTYLGDLAVGLALSPPEAWSVRLMWNGLSRGSVRSLRSSFWARWSGGLG